MRRSINVGILICFLSLAMTGCALADRVSGLLGKESDAEEVVTREDSEEALPVIFYDPPTIEVVSEEPEEVIEEEPEEDIYDDVAKIYSKHAASKEQLTLTFAGDVSFAEGYANMSTLYSQEFGIHDCIMKEVMDEMRGSDIMMINNEFPYSARGSAREGKKFTFRAKPENVVMLDDMGVDIVSLANNHAYDYGPEALMDTVDILKNAKIPFVGAGYNLEEACKPVYFRINRKTIAYVSATQIERTASPDTKEATADSPGVLRTLDATKFTEVIRNAEANSDFVVVYVHWGSENTDLVEQSQRDLANKYVEAGADLIIGDHSHCLQGVDYIGEVPVFYSLGNFWFNSKTVDTCLVRVTLNADCQISNVKFIPCIQKGCKTYLADNENKVRIINYMQGISNYASFSPEGNITRSDTDHNTQNGQNTSPSKRVETPEQDMALPMPEALPGTDAADLNHQAE